MYLFHLAIPSHDLELAIDFYVNKLGGRLYRRYEDRITLRFFDHQLVCHLNPNECAQEAKMYPHHFGITFVLEEDFHQFHLRCQQHNAPFLKPLFERWPNKQEHHLSFFLQDPSNNALEFKYYFDPQFIY